MSERKEEHSYTDDYTLNGHLLTFLEFCVGGEQAKQNKHEKLLNWKEKPQSHVWEGSNCKAWESREKQTVEVLEREERYSKGRGSQRELL